MIGGFIYHAAVEAAIAKNEFARYIGDAAKAVEAESKLNCSGRMVNVRTGRLRASHSSTVTSSGKGPVGIIRASAEYAGYVHAKRPFLTTALETVVRSL